MALTIYSSKYPNCILEIIEVVLFNFFFSKSSSNSTKKVIRKPNLANLFHRLGLRPTCGSFDTNGYLHFSVSLQSNNLMTTPYSDYQVYLHNKISELKESGLGYRRISDLLNKEGIKTCRGKTFSNSSVHSILKKKLIRDTRNEKEFDNKVSKFELKYI